MEDELAWAVAQGNSDAAGDLQRIQSLTDAEVELLNEFLESGQGFDTLDPRFADHAEIESSCSNKPNDRLTITDPVAATRSDLQNQTQSTTYDVVGRCTSTFSFLGVVINQTQLVGEYRTRSGKVVSTQRAYGRIVAAREPGVTLSYSDPQHWVSAGKGQFRAHLTATRTVAGHKYSTRSMDHAMRTNGTRVEACYWI